MKIADLLLDTNSEVSQENFVDFFNNKDVVRLPSLVTNTTQLVTNPENTGTFAQVVVSDVVFPAKTSERNEISSKPVPLIEASAQSSVEVIFGSYTSVITLGRGRTATINLGGSNRKVSRKHAIISWEETAGVFTLHVTGANGLYIDDSLHRVNCSVKLSNGCVIDIAGIKYRFQIPHMDYLPSPPFGSPAHIPETESNVTLSSFSVDSDASKITSQTNEEPCVNTVNRVKSSLRSQATKSNNRKTRSYRNISPASSICNGSFKSSDDLASDSEPLSLPSGLDPVLNSKAGKASGKRATVGKNKRKREKKRTQPEIDPVRKELIDNIVAAIVFTGKHMISASEIYKIILADHPTFPERYEEFNELSVVRSLHKYSFFGHVVRKGKDAGGKPLADLWYYTINDDPDTTRKSTYQPLVKGARSCTLKDKQYYFKPPPKVPSIKYSTQLPPSGRKRSKKSRSISGPSKRSKSNDSST
ncbi:hypothetical protein K7432_004620 [Basidiobolus ranarum]|uniref:FHA domain-containing protein n=1 Tax=Basidiobolus ranarum TaxID=34480 RepID=A0ABR2W5A0_9FUNG